MATSDKVAVTNGAFVVNGTNYIVLNFPNGLAPAGTYTLITNVTAHTGAGNFYLLGSYTNVTLNYNNNNVTLVIGAGGTYAGSSLTWKGNLSGTWDVGTANWASNGVSGVTYADGNVVTFDDTAATAGVSGGTVTPGSVIFNNNSLNYTLSASVAGPGVTNGLTKNGAGALTLTGGNTFNGGLTLNAGTLNLGSASALGAGTFAINGGTLDNTSGAALTNLNNNAQVWNGSFTFAGTANLSLGTGAVTLLAGSPVTVNANTLTVGGSITGSGLLTKNGAGTLTLAGSNTFSSGLTLNAGTLSVNSTNALGTGTLTLNGGTLDNTSGLALTNLNLNAQTWNSNFTFAGTANLHLGNGAVTLSTNVTVSVSANALTVGGPISGAFALTKLGAGQLTLSGSNSFSGGISLNAGVLNINSTNALGTGALTITNGTGVAIDNATGAALTNRNNNSITCSNQDLYFYGSSGLHLGNGSFRWFGGNCQAFITNTLTIGGAITYDVGNTGLTKNGPGTLIFAGPNNYAGALTVSVGTVLINGDARAATNLVTVSPNASFGGSGTNGGNVTLTNATLLPGGVTAVGTLTLTNTLTLNGTNKLFFKLANTLANGTNDMVAVGKGLTNNGVNTVYLTGAAPVGTNTLMTFASTNGGSGTFVLGITNPNVFLIYTPTSLQLAVTNTGYTSPLVWKGYQTGLWDDAVNQNWQSGTPTNFAAGNDVVFDDTLVANPVVSSAATVLPNSVTFNNSATAYTNAAIIGGAGALIKNGTGAATLTGSNSYAGPTTINAGSLVIGGFGLLGGGTYAGNITNNGSLTFNSSATNQQILAGNIAGAGTMTINSGAVMINGNASAATNQVTVNSGGALGGTGTNGGKVTLNSGGRLVPGRFPRVQRG